MEYNANTKDLPKFNGYIVISCGGSDLVLSNAKEVKKAFNVPYICFSKNYLARCNFSCIIDSYTHLILDCTLAENKSFEPKLAIEHIKNLSKRININRTITLYD